MAPTLALRGVSHAVYSLPTGHLRPRGFRPQPLAVTSLSKNVRERHGILKKNVPSRRQARCVTPQRAYSRNPSPVRSLPAPSLASMNSASSKTESLTTRASWLTFAKTVGFVFSIALPLMVARRMDPEQVGVYKQVFLVIGTAP